MNDNNVITTSEPANTIIEFTVATIYGSHFNKGERAAFTAAEAQMLVDGSAEQNCKPCATIVKRLSATELSELRAQGRAA